MTRYNRYVTTGTQTLFMFYSFYRTTLRKDNYILVVVSIFSSSSIHGSPKNTVINLSNFKYPVILPVSIHNMMVQKVNTVGKSRTYIKTLYIDLKSLLPLDYQFN